MTPRVFGQIVPEHPRGARPKRHESREQPKQRCLPGSVPTGKQDNLTLGHVQIDTSEGGEATEQAHSRAQTDDEWHSVSREQVP